MQQQSKLEYAVMKAVMEGIESSKLDNNPININFETGIMISFLRKKYKNNLWYIAECLGMKEIDILNSNFTKNNFKKLLNFYLREKK